MLIRPCYRVLKAVNYLCQNSKTTSSLDIMMYFHQRTKYLDLANTLKQLSLDGYITATFDEKTDDLVINIIPTYKGRHFRQYRWLATKQIILKSFILPILVSIITTLLTLFFTSLIQGK